MSDTTGVANEQGAGIPPIGETFNESTVFPDEVTLRPTRRFTKRGTPSAYRRSVHNSRGS